MAAQRSALEVKVDSFGENIISEISNFNLCTIDCLSDESYALLSKIKVTFIDFDTKFKFTFDDYFVALSSKICLAVPT